MNEVNYYTVEIYTKFSVRRLRETWRWRVTASNGRIIGASCQAYLNYKDCAENIRMLGYSLISSK